jgi:hypothetical protein
MRRPVAGAVVLTVLVAVLVGACESQGHSFQTTLATDSVGPLPVTLTDETNLVTGIAAAQADAVAIPSEPAVHAGQGDANALVLTWVGGACDQDAGVWFGLQNGRYLLNISVHGSSTNCMANAVPRAVRITISRPIPVDSIVVAGYA